MGCRSSGMAFMANKYVVFPAAAWIRGDQRIPVEKDLRPAVMARVARGITTARARGLALAAIRETFEETGILIGERGPAPRTRSPAWMKFFAHGVAPRLDTLTFIARAITPPNRTRRFDARFFMTDASTIAHALDAATHEELLKPALADARRGPEHWTCLPSPAGCWRKWKSGSAIAGNRPASAFFSLFGVERRSKPSSECLDLAGSVARFRPF